MKPLSHHLAPLSRVLVALVAVALPAIATAQVPPMKVHFIDVGQGAAILLEPPCGQVVLVDTGGERNAEFDGRVALLRYLDDFFASRPELDRTLALVAITHPHRDHTQAARAVMARYTVQNVVVNGQEQGSGWSWRERERPAGPERSQGQKEVLDLARSMGIPWRTISFGERSDVQARTDEVIDPVDCRQATPSLAVDPKIQVLWGELGQDPGWGFKEFDGRREDHFDNGNNHSLVLRVDFGDASLLLTGDLETAAMPDLLRTYGDQPGGPLDVDVYHAGHHGSHNGTSEELLAAMTPQIAVISMGPSERRGPWYQPFSYTAYQHGHPRRSLVQLLQDAVELRRRSPEWRQVARGVRSFEAMRIRQCVFATGWEGTVVVTLETDGRVNVVEPLGGAPACAPPPPPPPPEPMAALLAEPAEVEAAAPELPWAAVDARPLAPRPFCEASAALAAPWDEDLVLVADNERHQQLYAFEVKGCSLEADEVWRMPDKKRPRDIEALAQVGESLVVVGSHSRDKRCNVEPDRQRLRRLEQRDGCLVATGFIDSASVWAQATASPESCLSTLFTSPPPEGASAVCAALALAEQSASQESCGVLNVEGAFGTADGHLWLGLRAPQVGGRAMLLRLAGESWGRGTPTFDRVASLDLGGLGIRELAVAGDLVYGLAGPAADAVVPFALFSATASEVLAGGQPTVTLLRRDLPPSSEGLLVRDGKAYVLLDGDQGESDTECAIPAGWFVLDLPLAN